MIYLILDTNNWIYLANGLDPINNKHHDSLHFELLKSLRELKEKKQVTIIVNDIVINEWGRNKEHCRNKIKKLEQKLHNKDGIFNDIIKYSKDDTKQLQDNFAKGIEEEIRKNEEHIQNVEDFLTNDCIKVDISQEVKLQIYELSIDKKAPFHNNKNNTGDAAILLSAVEYLKTVQDLFGYQAFFISNNIQEYTDGKNLEEFHPQLESLLSGVNIQYERVLPSALNISKQIIDEMQHFATEFAKRVEHEFTWDLQLKEDGILMFLDVNYYNNFYKQNDYLTICVAKDNGKNRPRFISFILPRNLSIANGIFLYFAKTKKDIETGFPVTPDMRTSTRVYFETISDKTCIARIWEGYAKNENTGIITDIFNYFIEYDHFFVMYINEDSSPQTILVPLFSFRQQFILLPN